MSFFVFWLSLFSLIYVYAGFAVLVMIVGAILDRRVKKKSITPNISLIIAAYNEEDSIAARLDNVLGLDYPADKLQVLVASDGSTDATERIVAGYEDRGVTLLSLPRRGKIHALNDTVGKATGEILVFSDANSMYEKKALDRKSTRLNSSHTDIPRMPSSA